MSERTHKENGGRSRVAVVGGGLVGATTALVLADLGFRVTLVDRGKPALKRGQLGLDLRHVALSHASRALLEKAGIWTGVIATAYRHMCVWEQWGDGQLHFDAADIGVGELGWLVEMSPLVCAAWRRMEGSDAIELIMDTIQDVHPAGDGVILEFMSAEACSYDFLVAADGAHSMVRKALDLPVLRRPMDQHAIATVVRTQNSHEHTAWQCFLLEGPLAFLPGPDEHLCSVVWSQSADTAERRMHLDDAAFCREIGAAFNYRLGEITEVDERAAFPLIQQRVKYCRPHARVLLVGDALRVVHPMAGQGVNLGLEDVQGLLEVAVHHIDLAKPGIWQRYARQRERRSAMMIEAMALLQRTYGDPKPSMALLRNLGVRSFNRLDALKHRAMREVMGLDRVKSGPY